MTDSYPCTSTFYWQPPPPPHPLLRWCWVFQIWGHAQWALSCIRSEISRPKSEAEDGGNWRSYKTSIVILCASTYSQKHSYITIKESKVKICEKSRPDSFYFYILLMKHLNIYTKFVCTNSILPCPKSELKKSKTTTKQTYCSRVRTWHNSLTCRI